jgi:hypothetical protein
MSTIHNIHGDMTAGAAVLQPTDEIAIYEASSGLHKKLTGALALGGNPTLVNTTATLLSLTQAAHANRIVTVSSTSPIAITLPAASGTGNTYTLVQLAAATATSHTYKALGTDVLQGVAWVSTTSTDNAEAFATSATSDKVSVNGTTTGGIVGDKWVFVDVASGKWNVQGYISQTGNTATPFSET